MFSFVIWQKQVELFQYFFYLNNCNKVCFEGIVFLSIGSCIRVVSDRYEKMLVVRLIYLSDWNKRKRKTLENNVFLFNAVAGITGVVMTLSLILMMSSATELIRFAFDYLKLTFFKLFENFCIDEGAVFFLTQLFILCINLLCGPI